MVSKGGASGARTVLDGTATGHTQQSAAHWTFKVLQPFSQHGARHARVDACVWLGSGTCRYRERPKAGTQIRLPRVGARNQKGDPLGHPLANRLKDLLRATRRALFRCHEPGLGYGVDGELS